MLAACGRTVKLAATPTAQFRCADGDPGAGVISASSTGGPVVSQDIVVAALVASNGTTRRVVPGCPRRSGSSTRVGADRRAAGPVLSADVSVLGHRPGRCRVGRRCAGAGPDVRADCPPAVSRTGRGPRKGLMGAKGDGGKHDSGTAGPDDVVGGGLGGDVDVGVIDSQQLHPSRSHVTGMTDPDPVERVPAPGAARGGATGSPGR